MIKHLKIFILCFGIVACNSHKHSHDHASNETHHHNDDAQDYFSNYTIQDKMYGTKTEVKIKGSKRIMTTNALPNHKTGEFPNQGNPNTISAQQRTYEFPLNPKYTGNAHWAREPGIALNGIKFEPQTAEVVICDTGENYRVEAIQDVIDLGLDFNHAHVQPTGAYHYHGTPTSIIDSFDTGKDLVHIGFAHDGFPMYYSKSGAYKPSFKLLNGNRDGEDCSYTNPHQSMDISVGGHHDGTYGSDYEYIADSGDLDECNGITVDSKYMYLVTKEFPYVGRCLMGEYEAQRPPRQRNERGGERPDRGRGQMQGGRRQGSPPSFKKLLEMMDTNKDKKLSKKEVKGPLSEMFDTVDANKDGFLTEEELKKAPQPNHQGPPRGGRH